MDINSITGFVTKAVGVDLSLGWIIFIVFILFLLIFTIRHFLDIAIDLWKLPFAIVLDALKILFFGNTIPMIFVAAANVFVFWILAKRKQRIGKYFGAITGFLCLGGIFYLQDYSFLFSIIPFSSIIMFISIWAD